LGGTGSRSGEVVEYFNSKRAPGKDAAVVRK
jgi:hypothetical protein